MKTHPAVLLRCCLSCIALMSAASVRTGASSPRMAPGGSGRAQPPALMQTSKHTQGLSDVLYGVMTTGLPQYQAKLAAQLETWAAGFVLSGRFFSVAGRGAGVWAGAGLIVEDRCEDGGWGIACKEERLLEEGYTRGAQWLVILGEDNWVDTVQMEEALRNHVAGQQGAAPMALGVVGCGKNIKNISYCPEVSQLGGFCGGGGYAINRAALKALMKGGKDALRKEYADMRGVPGDMASSCALRRRGVQLMGMPSLVGHRFEKLTEFRNVLGMRPITLHYCTPDVMRWVHASFLRLPEPEVQAREVAAFDGKGDVRHSPLQLHVQGGLPPLTLEDLRDAYIRERDGQLRGD